MSWEPVYSLVKQMALGRSATPWRRARLDEEFPGIAWSVPGGGC
jgi:hypothetical protein